VARRGEDHPVYQWLTGMREISHRTLSGFRVEYQQELDELFAQVLAALRGAGMITLERMVQDGTKVKAAASPASLHREATLPQHLEVARERVRQRGDPRQDQPEQNVRQRQAQERAAREKLQRLRAAGHAGGHTLLDGYLQRVRTSRSTPRAFVRMRLYQVEYGLSEQRLYPTAFMGWLAVVFVWFCLTVLRGHRERFAFGAMVAGFLLVATLQVLNPDALIARTNMARSCAGHTFDARYVGRLSADAVPELVAGLPTMNPVDRRTLAKAMLESWTPPEKPDWRSWTLSRAQAWQAVSANMPTLRAACAETKK
jgi:hypothetical protein